ncbi:MAG: hypothetical protein IAB19_05060 [Proteobacteria bacterium]|uniref:Uncharacterized protein n=1 Tax=Candidatus Avisuccinivibrio stercorigallinarum TaxID=2840704 RepID=A0A9D9D9S4_9GAMM|nr:hypothetical protein [Candidatus Avisuccinivibrio stercorigallinarum]
MSEQKFFGVEAFGLRDQASSCGLTIRSEDYFPSCVIQSQKYGIAAVTGSAAKNDCTELGYPYPQDSRLERSDGVSLDMRRAMVGLVWKKLMLGNETDERWGKYSCSKLIAEHVAGLLGSDFSTDDWLTLAIPNYINEYAQEYLLRNLSQKLRTEREHVKLIWRNVAAAMSWLDDESKIEEFNHRFAGGGCLGVLYLGLDGVEYSSFQIVTEDFKENGRRYFVPKRDLPSRRQRFAFDGFDLFDAALSSDRSALPDDVETHWQLLNRCDDVWKLFLGLKYLPERHLFYIDNHWAKAFAMPSFCRMQEISGQQQELSVPLQRGLINEKLFAPPKDAYKGGRNAASWFDGLCGFVEENRSADLEKHKKLSALIITGPLSSSVLAGKMAKRLGLSYNGSDLTGQELWYSTSDDIAQGCAVFSERVSAGIGIPTYTDELQQLSIFIYEKGSSRLNQFKLISEETIYQGWPAGRESYRFSLNKVLALRENSSSLEVKLAKGDFDWYSDDNQLRKGKVKFRKTAQKQIPLITEIEMSPASGFARISFKAAEDDDSSKLVVDESLKHGREFEFDKMKKATIEDLKPDLNNLAYPTDRVYDLFTAVPTPDVMEKAYQVQSVLDNIGAFDSTQLLMNCQAVLDALARQPKDEQDEKRFKMDIVKLIRVFNKSMPEIVWFGRSWIINKNGQDVRYYLFNEKGELKIKEYAARYHDMAERVNSICEPLVLSDRLQQFEVQHSHLMFRVAQLRNYTSKTIKDELLLIFKGAMAKGKVLKFNYFKAASLCFHEYKYLSVFFKYFETVFSVPENRSEFNYNMALGLSKSLDSCPEAKHSLNRECALCLIETAIYLMKAKLEEGNITRTFKVAAFLILCALKFRNKESHFLQLDGEDKMLAGRLLNDIQQTILAGVDQLTLQMSGQRHSYSPTARQRQKRGQKNTKPKSLKTLQNDKNFLTNMHRDITNFFKNKGDYSALELYRDREDENTGDGGGDDDEDTED